MTTARSIESRLRKLEAARPQQVLLYIVWGTTEQDTAERLAALQGSGAIRPREDWVALVWADRSPMPPSRRVNLASDGEDGSLGERELELLCRWFEAEAVRMEREAAIQAGEDIIGMDDTDFCIRSLRRTNEGLSLDYELRRLQNHDVPEPADISAPSHREWRARVRAWEERYLGPQSPGSRRTAVERLN